MSFSDLPLRNNINLDSSDPSSDSDPPSVSTSASGDEGDLLSYDPTPWDNPYPQPQWFSFKQIMSREYGKNTKPALLNKRSDFTSYSPYWFKKYAYNSLYFIQRMEMSDILESHTGCVNCLNFNTTGKLLCSGSDDLQINIWDWQLARLKHTFSSGHTSNIFQSRWCLDDTHIITCARDGQVRLLDINNAGSSRPIAHHLQPVHKCTFTDPHVVLSAGEDGAIWEIDLRSKRDNLLFILRNNKEHPVSLYTIHCAMAFTPHYFAVAGKSSKVSIFDRRFIPNPGSSGSLPSVSNTSSDSSSDRTNQRNPASPAAVMELVASVDPNTIHSITSAVYNSMGSKILVSYNDDDLYVFDIKTGRQEGKYQGHRNSETIKGCSWYSDDFVLSGSDDGHIYGWDRKSQHIIMSVQADNKGAVNCLEMHPQFPVIASCGIDDSIKIWEPTSDSWPKTLTGIKKRICQNMRDRSLESTAYRFDTGSLAILVVTRDIRQRMRDVLEREDDNSDSHDADDNSADGSCLPS